MRERQVLLLGATGLVGAELLKLLLADERVRRVVVITRRPTGAQHPKLDEHVFPLDDMEDHADAFAVDQVFCALGTTIRRAGSKEAFRHVDHDLPIGAGRLARARGASHFLLVSSLGANRLSRLFYPRVKGEVEHDVAQLGVPSVTIVRPSFLTGPRAEFRLGEQIIARLGFLMPLPYKPIPAAAVARALVTLAEEDVPGVRIIESLELQTRYR